MIEARSRQRGAALIVVLIALLAMALTAITAMRAALNADQVAGNLIAQTLAREAAYEALRYCERELLEDRPAIAILAAPAEEAGPAWQDPAAWDGAQAQATSVSQSRSPGTQSPLPQCLAEASPLDADEVVLITARGFSPDYLRDDGGQVLSGSVVWLQSLVSLVER